MRPNTRRKESSLSKGLISRALLQWKSNKQKNMKMQISLFLIYFGPGSIPAQRSHSWVVEFQSQYRFHRNTIICPYNVFNELCYIPFLQCLPVASYLPYSSPSLPSYMSTSTASTALCPLVLVLTAITIY